MKIFNNFSKESNNAAVGRLDSQEQLYLNQLSNLHNLHLSNTQNPNQMQNFQGEYQNFNQATPYNEVQRKFIL